MAISEFPNLTEAVQGGCPDCGTSSDIVAADQYDPCNTVEESAGEVVVILFQCGKNLAFSAPETPAITDFEGYLTGGDAVAKATEGYAKAESSLLTRTIAYTENPKPTGKVHTFTWRDTLKDTTNHAHRAQYNLVTEWAENFRLGGAIVITQNDEAYFYVAASGKDTTFSVDDPQAEETGSVETLSMSLGITIRSTKIAIPTRIEGLYASIAAKVNGLTLAA